MVELAKFRNSQCAKITSREKFETANREIYQLAKKTGFFSNFASLTICYRKHHNISKCKK